MGGIIQPSNKIGCVAENEEEEQKKSQEKEDKKKKKAEEKERKLKEKEDKKKEENKKSKESLETFVQKHFHEAECRFFSVDKDNDIYKERCKCGETKENHKDDTDPVKSIEINPSSTFGEIEFEGENIIKKDPTYYVRLSHEDEVEKVFELLEDYWSVKMGKLAISVIGGAKNFKMSETCKEVFMNVLKKATKTNALIITAGLNVGIAKEVGQAVKERQILTLDNNKLCCLGISPWGYVRNRKLLADKQGEAVKYEVSDEIETNQPVSLNANHTHYLFVDEGRRNQFRDTKAGEFRAKFESYLVNEKSMSVVLVIVEGGYDVFQEAARSAKLNIPIVICEGTGRAADVLGEAYRERMNCQNKKLQSSEVFKFSEEFKISLVGKLKIIKEDYDSEKVWEYIETIMKSESLITTFNMKTSEDLDNAILNSLIKKVKNNEKQDEDIRNNKKLFLDNIELSLFWDCVDIARDEIFKYEIKSDSENWKELLKQSIIAGKVEFIELFLDNGASITDRQLIKDLYNENEGKNYFDKTLQFYYHPKNSDLDNFDLVNELLTRMIKRVNVKVYEKKEEEKQEESKKKKVTSFNDLLIWSVLTERHECAKIFWERCEDATFMALVATMLYSMQNKSAKHDIQRKQKLDQLKDYFEDMAIKVIEECHDKNPKYAEQLLQKNMKEWGDITCLELAFKAKDLKFISSIACQNAIDKMWYTVLRSPKHCVIGIFFPWYILHKIKKKEKKERKLKEKKDKKKKKAEEKERKFKEEEEQKKSQEKEDKKKENSNGLEKEADQRKLVENADKEDKNKKKTDKEEKKLKEKEDKKKNQDPINGTEQIKQFYTAPQTKFMIHFILYLAFVLYNSIVILYFMRRDNLTNPHELIFIIYHICFIIDRFIEMMAFDKRPPKNRPRAWLDGSFWRILDVIIGITSFIGIVLAIARIGTRGQTLIYVYRAAKTFYSLTVGLFYLRFLRLLTLNHSLGPKMVMILQMLLELFQYLLIIVIILLSYGVASQATYYTEQTFSIDRLLAVISDPYWSLFGELRTDETVYFKKCNMSIATDSDGGCPEYSFVVPILYAFYIFIGNILLLNVLIAIFSHIFQEIHPKSHIIWKYNKYSMVREYKNKPILPPPFSLFEYSVRRIIHIKKGECYNKVDVVEVNLLQAVCLKSVIKNKRIEEQRSIETHVCEMSQELKTLGTSVSVINENFTNNSINGKSVWEEKKELNDSLPSDFMNSLNSALDLRINKKLDEQTRRFNGIDEKINSKTTNILNDLDKLKEQAAISTLRYNELGLKLEEQATITRRRLNELDEKLETYQKNTITALQTIDTSLQDIVRKLTN